MKLHLVNVSEVDEAMTWRLMEWRNSERVSPFFLLERVTEDQHRAWLGKNRLGADALAYVIHADDTPLGMVYFPWIDRNAHSAEIGIYLYEQGFRELRPASFAYHRMMEMAVQELGVKCIYARILDNNEKSIRFHERLGFVRLPEQDSECDRNGERRQVLMYMKEL